VRGRPAAFGPFGTFGTRARAPAQQPGPPPTSAWLGTPVRDVDEDVTGITSTTAPVIAAGPAVAVPAPWARTDLASNPMGRRYTL
jgi:hypothetical protein